MKWIVRRLIRCSRCWQDLPPEFFHRDWCRPPLFRQRVCKRCRSIDKQKLNR